MKKASLFASAAVASVALAGVPAFAQGGGGPFADVPTDHWAYGSVDRLQREGIVIGYPDGTFGGKRAMTRYEFAVAIARMLERVGTPPDLSNYVTREQLNTAIAGLPTREEVAQIRRLVQEFQNELTTLGVDLDATKRRVDALEGRVTNLENEFKRVKIGGSANLMVRGNHRQGGDVRGIIDRDGYRVTGGRGSRGSLLADTRVLHDLDLSIRARLSETATAEAVVNFGNYLDFLNSVASHSGARSDRGNSLNPALNQRANQGQEQTIYKLALEAPVRLPGIGGVNLAVGRIPIQFTPYTLKLIDVDSYFFNEKTDLGDIPVDGARGAFKLGPVGVTAFAAKVDPVKHVSNINGKITGDSGYGLYAGAGTTPFGGTNALNGGFRGGSVPYVDENGAVTVTGNRPRGSSVRGTGTGPEPNVPVLGNGAMAVENIGGVRATFGSPRLGTIGATYLALGGQSAAPGLGTVLDFDRVNVYGADINTTLAGFGIMGAYTKSDTRSAAGRTRGKTTVRRDDETAAWEAGASFATGALSLGAGYREIDPFFAAPGFWAKLGSWTNPVDIKGPFVTASYALGGGITLAAEGHFYEGTGKAINEGGLSDDDGVTHYKAGLKYGLTSASSVDLGVEYTSYDLRNSNRDPREVFYNIGYGFSFNPTTSFKLLYQVVDYNDKGTGFDTQNRKGGVAAAQFSVKF
jgi:hypothetical protein